MTQGDRPEDDRSTPPVLAEYVVVLRTRSSARFWQGEACEFNFAAPGLGLGPLRVRTFTSWVATGQHSLPRELIVEVRGQASALDEAVTKFAVVGRPIATMAGFVANVRVGLLEVHLAYDCTDGHEERDFLETFLPDERGGVAEGGKIHSHLMSSACSALLGLGAESARISRALRQYELALREWRVGGEWLALSHLYMAVETLTKAVIRKITADRSVSEQELAQSLGVVTDDPERPRWRQILGQRVREQVIFAGETETYAMAKEASDGLEHGHLEFDEITRRALQSADRTFFHVRRTIIELLRLPPEIADELLAIKLKDVQSRRKVARGRLVGARNDPAPEGALYPHLEWNSEIGSSVREGSSWKASEQDRITVRTHPTVGFQLTRLELHGRLEDGQAPVEINEQNVLIEPTPGSKAGDLLSSVMPLVDAATASGADTGQTLPRIHAFNLFGQGVAFFQSAHTLINTQQPIEALPSLLGLTTIAARFEQIAEPSGPGMGVVLRLVLDALEDGPPSDSVRAHELRDALLNGAANAGITVPDALPAPAATTIWRSLTVEMQLAHQVSSASFAAAMRHVERSETDQWDFHVRLQPNALSDMIASACVIAQLRLLQLGAGVFGWTIDAEKVNGLLARAEELNEASANPPDEERPFG